MSINYRIAEKQLYSYPVNMMRYQEAMIAYMRLRGETDCHAQSYRERLGAREPGDPPGDYVNRLMRAEHEVKKYSLLTRPVREVRRDLRDNAGDREVLMLQVMELYYFEGLSMRELAMHLGQNERTLYRRREELVREVMRR